MKITHTTLAKNKDSILAFGILGSYCRAGNGRIWLHDASIDSWAENHVRSIHDAPGEDLIHIVVDVPRSWVKKHSGSMYYVMEDITPAMFVSARVVWTATQEIALR